MTERVLLVDDEPNVLRGYRRHLRKQFDVALAEGGRQALELLESQGPFAVVVSDMQMPDVTGVQVLAKVADDHADTVRIMLTGNADQKTAVDAVNEGQIFRFLSKPCLPETLVKTLDAGLRQYQLVRAEHDLLTKTLSGSVSLMTEVLSLVNPQAFGRAARVKTLAGQICTRLNVPNGWEVQIAAMLSQIGCVSVPQPALEKYFDGRPLSTEEQRLLDAHPSVGAELVRKIPRLEGAAHLIQLQNGPVEERGTPEASAQDVPLGARILRIVLDYDGLATSTSPPEAVQTIRGNYAGTRDAQVAEALAEIINVRYDTRSLSVAQLAAGMIFDEHVETLAGGILIAKGQEVNESLLDRLRSFAESAQGVRQPIRVRCYVGPPN